MSPAVPASMPEIGFAFGLSAISGFVDTAGFIQLAGGFTAHITGNFVLVGAALSGDGGQGIVERLALVPIFIAAVVRASWLGRAAIRHRRSAVSTLLYAEAGALALYVALGFGFRHALRANASGAPLMLTAGAAVVAMGLQNALMREGLKTLLPTTVMTGNLTQFSLDLAALAFPEGDTALRARRHRHAVVLTGFLIGATAGAWAALDQSFLIRAIPMFAVLWLARRSAGLVAA